MALERIARMPRSRSPQGRRQEQLFWLIDVVHACTSSSYDRLAGAAFVAVGRSVGSARTPRQATGRALDDATTQAESRAPHVAAVMRTVRGLQEE